MNEYIEQAEDFLNKTNTKLSVKLIGTKPHFSDSDEWRDVYWCSLVNDRSIYSFEFGDSIYNTKARAGKLQVQDLFPFTRNVSIYKLNLAQLKAQRVHKIPNAYDILACLNIDYSEDFEEFCDEYGYSDDSLNARNIYDKVRKETKSLKRLFTEDELEQLHEIA